MGPGSLRGVVCPRIFGQKKKLHENEKKIRLEITIIIVVSTLVAMVIVVFTLVAMVIVVFTLVAMAWRRHDSDDAQGLGSGAHCRHQRAGRLHAGQYIKLFYSQNTLCTY